jgi:hypothetical protein
MQADPQRLCMFKPDSIFDYLVPAFFLAFGLIFIALPQSDFFRAVPGDMGDARFNSLILEHVYRWIIGKDPSLWSPGFFYPYPGSLTFSDNHLGTVLIYAVLRGLGVRADDAFIIWYTVAAPLNYLCCYYALKKCGLSSKGSAIGAFIFAFALAATAQYEHAQLNYRFAIPLAMLSWQRFIDCGGARHLAMLAVWLTVQFYCSIYLGYFLLLLLGASFCALYLVRRVDEAQRRPHRMLYDVLRFPSDRHFLPSVIVVLVCIVALVALFYPYLHFSRLYGFRRTRVEIGTMLPRVWSYFIADDSRLWGHFGKMLPDVPMREEQQMFFGLGASVLAVIGSIGNASRWIRSTLISLLLLVLMTLSVHKYSIYLLFTHLPIASAIRAVSRICSVMLFPVGVLAGAGYDWLVDSSGQKSRTLRLSGCHVLTLVLLVECAAINTQRVPVGDWRNHLTVLQRQVSAGLRSDAILFIPLRDDAPLFMTEVDGMSLAQSLGMNTLNGYSGNAPPNFYNPGASPCDQAMDRLVGYVNFAKKNRSDANSLMSRVYIIGERKPCAAEVERPTYRDM